MRKIGSNVLALALFWGLGFAVVRVFAGLLPPSGSALIASAIGVAIALRLRAFVAAVLLVGQVAFALAELGVHLAFGTALRGGEVHLAIMIAGTLGVAFGALLTWRASRRPLSTTP